MAIQKTILKKYIIAVITLSTWNFQFLKTENISHAERLLLWFIRDNVVNIQLSRPQYRAHCSTYKTVYIVAWQHAIPYLYVQPSS
jgi:hypothetical protein